MAKKRQVYSLGGKPINEIMTDPIIGQRAPTAADLGYPLGQLWVYAGTGAYVLTNVAAGAATWAAVTAGVSDVDKLTGDAGGAILPAAGNITLAGGTSITSTGAGNTITFALDDAISPATSVTSPLYTAPAASDLLVTSIGGQDIVVKLGDAAGANEISFTDSADAARASIDSDGTATFVNMDGIIGATTPAAGSFTTVVAGTAYTTTAATDININSIAGQDVIIKMGDAAAANKVSFTDSAGVEVASIDSNGGLTMVAFTFAGLLTAPASATIETAGVALNLGSDNDAGAVNIGVGTVARAISIGTSAAAHTVSIGNAAAGAIAVDTAAGISLDGATASNFTVTGAGEDLTLAGAGGAVNVTSTEGENDAILIEASAANGGVQIRAGTGGILIGQEADTSGIALGNIAPTATRNINIGGGTVVTAAVTDTINIGPDGATTNANSIKTVNLNTGGVAIGEVNTNIATGAITSGTHATAIASGNVAAGTVTLNMFTGTGTKTASIGNSDGLTTINVDGVALINDSVDVATSINTGTSTGAVSIGNALAGTVTVDSAALIEVNVAAAGVISIGTDAVAKDITIGTTTTTSSLVLAAGTGDITVSGTVKEINAEFLSRSGDDVTFQSSPICMLSGNAPALPTGATGTVNLLGFPEMTMEQFVIGAGQTIIAPVMDATGLLISGDLTATEGFEYNFGAALETSRHAFTVGTSPAFFMECSFTVADVSGCEPLMMGFRKVEANNATITSYTDYALIGLDNVTSPGNVVISTELNSGGTTNTNTTDAWADAATHTLQVLVSAAGVVTYTIDGGAPSSTAAFTFDADVVVPMVRLTHGAGSPGTIHWNSFKCGYQA